MRLDQYTPDAICHAMGISQFVDDSWARESKSAFRVLFKPSLAPATEVCITVAATDAGTTASVVVLKKMLWSMPFPCTLPRTRENLTIADAASADLFHSLTEAIAETQRPPREIVICDGMQIDCAWHVAGDDGQFSMSVVGESLTSFSRKLIQTSWDTSQKPAIRNGLAWCGRFTDLSLPLDPNAERTSKDVVIGVFGTPDDRQDYFDLLDSRPDD